MKKKTRSHNKTINFKYTKQVIGVGIVVVAIGAMGYGLNQLFTVRSVTCSLADGTECPTELRDKLSVLNNKAMFFTDYKKILDKNSTISQPYSLQKISKRLPGTIMTVFAAEQPLVLLHQQDSLHVISTTGKAFPQTEETAATLSHLLLVESEQSLIQDNMIAIDVLEVLKTIIASQEELSLPLEKINWVDKSTIKLSMKERTELAIIDSESPAVELQRLSLILQSQEYQNLAESKQELDLRFTMPVLRTEP